MQYAYLLVIAYVSAAGEPSIVTHPQLDKASCQARAVKMHRQVKVGSVRAWCHKITEKKEKEKEKEK